MSRSTNAAEFDPDADDVFARIAGRYDRLCDIFSLGVHRLWKRRMATLLACEQASLVLDVASGTGDIPARLIRRLRGRDGGPKRILVSDLCPQMLDRAKRKLQGAAGVELRQLDAHNLDLPDASVDLYTISFGLKICDRARVVAEARRVLRPGGVFYCLEAARIPFEPLHQAYLAYMDWCLPLIGWIATGGDAGAYNYLLRGVHAFPSARDFAAELGEAGFENVAFENLTFGIVAIHRATTPT